MSVLGDFISKSNGLMSTGSDMARDLFARHLPVFEPEAA